MYLRYYMFKVHHFSLSCVLIGVLLPSSCVISIQSFDIIMTSGIDINPSDVKLIQCYLHLSRALLFYYYNNRSEDTSPSYGDNVTDLLPFYIIKYCTKQNSDGHV